MQWIDVHAHLDMLEAAPEEVLKESQAVGVQKLITIGTEPSDHEFVLKTARRLYPDVYCTLGVHPHQGVLWQESVGQWIEEHLEDRSVVGIGEIGLDYHYNQSPKQNQIEAFTRQMEMAARTRLPVQIHSRDADDDMAHILKAFQGQVKGLIHCFTSSAQLAETALDCGFNISFSGVVTFKNAQNLREICAQVPLDRLHVETDAPFLAPVPHRGQKNKPAFVVETAQVVADIKQVSLAVLAEATRQNALKLFPKIVW